ncbi:hypothetical protein BDZ45DRAFT_742919 [Acephala macrosclerotiorum]|nr:hypothetical protein BDZ45DRAFT_742919 [Acephala macrosclerotiorum]
MANNREPSVPKDNSKTNFPKTLSGDDALSKFSQLDASNVPFSKLAEAYDEYNKSKAVTSESEKGPLGIDISNIKFYKSEKPSVGYELPEVTLCREAEVWAAKWSVDPLIQRVKDPYEKASMIYQCRVLAQLTTITRGYTDTVRVLREAFEVPPTRYNVKHLMSHLKFMDEQAREFYDLAASADWWMPKELKMQFWKRYRWERDAVKKSRDVLRMRTHNAVVWAMGKCENLRSFLVGGDGELGLLGWELLHLHEGGVVVPDTWPPMKKKSKKKGKKKGKEKGKGKEKASTEDVPEEEKHKSCVEL